MKRGKLEIIVWENFFDKASNNHLSMGYASPPTSQTPQTNQWSFTTFLEVLLGLSTGYLIVRIFPILMEMLKGLING